LPDPKEELVLLEEVGRPAARFDPDAAAPVPERLTDVGLLVALLVTDNEPVRVPVPLGWNVTLTVHEAPAAIDEPQPLVWLKSPLAATADTVAVAVPEFARVTVWARLVAPTVVEPKVSDDGDAARVEEVPLPDPVPVKETVAGPLPALLETVNVPALVPELLGWNVTLTTQEEPVARLPQLLVWL
jgi:hypothetical protein